MADADAERAKLLAARHGAAAVRDCGGLLARDSVGVVAIATPPHDHAGLALAALAAARRFTHPDRAERQLMRVDFGAAEARVHGWIPLRAELDIRTDDPGAAFLGRLARRGAALFETAGYQRTGGEVLAVTIERRAGPARATGRGRPHQIPHHARVDLALGPPADKQRVYAGSVRAAVADLARCATAGGRGHRGAS